jgi:hypothetical protein
MVPRVRPVKQRAYKGLQQRGGLICRTDRASFPLAAYPVRLNSAAETFAEPPSWRSPQILPALAGETERKLCYL